MKEIEIKIKLADSANLIKKVESLGGKKRPENFEHDTMYDDGKGFFDNERVLRLRKATNGNLLTYKEKDIGDHHDNLLKRTEIQTKVDDCSQMDAILRKLGFIPYRIKEKISTEYELDGFILDFHKIPFLGDFLEIEADEDKLPAILAKIGFSLNDGINKNYTKLFFEFCDQNGLSHDLPQTFEEEKRHSLQ
ncbi:MAG TPA: class IV adenylate cyclase [Patescibacteria group bacterium]|jgi:predicted adenylyl cyclase CyaB|nr:class IV adenylate cyclase [Patescibacteria group bacterium]